MEFPTTCAKAASMTACGASVCSAAATWRRAATGVGEGTGLLLDQAKRLESLHHQAEREADVEICVSCTHVYDDASTLIAAQHGKVRIDGGSLRT